MKKTHGVQGLAGVKFKVTGRTNTKENATNDNGEVTFSDISGIVAPGDYVIKVEETQSAGSNYVNILKEKYIQINITIDKKGNLIVNNYTVFNSDGTQAIDLNYSEYITISADNDTKTINLIIENPTTIKLYLYKKCKNTRIEGATFEIYSSIDDSTKTYTSKSTGAVVITEDIVRPGDYYYLITETETANDSYYNPFIDSEGKIYYVKVNVHVDYNGKTEITELTVVDDVNNAANESKSSEILNYLTYSNNNNKIYLTVQNTSSYKMNLVKVDTENETIDGSYFTVYRDGKVIYNNGEVTDETEISEDGIQDGNYCYYITETSTKTEYENIFKLGESYNTTKYIKIYVNVKQGVVTLCNSSFVAENNYFEIYQNGRLNGNTLIEGSKIVEGDEYYYLYDYVKNISVVSQNDNYIINVEVSNPTSYRFELTKQNAIGTTVAGSSFSVIYNDENGDLTTVVAPEDNIADNLYEINPVNAGTYTYYITEEDTIDDQYVNIFTQTDSTGTTWQYFIKVVIDVSATGEISIQAQGTGYYSIYRYDSAQYSNLYNYLENLQGTPNTVTNENISSGEFVTINVTSGNNGILYARIKNPVKYNVNITKTDTAGNALSGTTFKVLKSEKGQGYNLANSDYTTHTVYDGEVTEDIEIEDVISTSGTYTYFFTETSTASNNYNNILEGKYIKAGIYVSGDGNITVGNGTISGYIALYTGDINNMNSDDPVEYLTRTTNSANLKIWKDSSGFITVKLQKDTNTNIWTINLEVENPVNIKVDVQKYDTANEPLNKAYFTASRYSTDKSEGEKLNNSSAFIATEDVELEDNAIEAGVYTYYFTEAVSGTPYKYVNVLSGKVIKVNVKINADGTIQIGKGDKASTFVEDDGYFEIYYYSSINSDGSVTLSQKVDSSDDAYTYVKGVSVTKDSDGINIITLNVQNPTYYYVSLVKHNAANEYVSGSKFTIVRQDPSGNLTTIVENDDVGSTFIESPMSAGNYVYYITETETPGTRYVNILEGKYIKVYLTVGADGTLTITNSNHQSNGGYYEIYDYDMSTYSSLINLLESGAAGTKSNEDFSEYVNTNITYAHSTGVNILQINVIDPVKYYVDIAKFETSSAENSSKSILSGTSFTAFRETVSTNVSAKIIDKQDPSITSPDAEETPILAGNYIYYYTEDQTAADGYTNILEGKYIKIYVTVAGDGTVTIMNSDFTAEDDDFYELYEGNIYNRKNTDTLIFTNDGIDNDYEDERTQYIATLISVNIITEGDKYLNKLDTTINAVTTIYDGDYTIGVTVQNPVNYKIIIDKTIWGAEEQDLEDATFYIWSSSSGEHKNLETDNEGNITIQEDMISAGTYTYLVTEQETPGDEFVNVLDGKALRITVEISSSGEITSYNYEVVKIVLEKLLNTEVTQEYVDILAVVENVGITDDRTISMETEIDENNVSELHIKIKDPQKYEFGLIKTDKDTEKAINDVEFGITVTKYDDASKTWNKISLSNAYTFETINTSSLITANVDGQDGVISITDILIESEGTYRYSLHEQTIDESIFGFLYKTHAEDIVIEITIKIENGKYVISEMSTIAGGDYVSLLINDDGYLTTGVKNERIKGKYDLEFTKIDSYTESPLAGATFEVTAEKDGEEYTLYQSNDDVESQDVLIPTTVTTDENGYFEIENIRIEHIETYTIILTEIEAPEGYMLLDEPIRLTVTTTTEGEYDDETFVIESVVLESDIYGLVEMDYDEDEIEVEAKNEYFDLALRKSITSVSYEDGTDDGKITEEDTADRVPDVDSSDLMEDTDTTAIYNHNKEPIKVYAGQYVIYTLRVYNEGEIDGYAEEVTDHLPEWLEYVDDEFNSSWGWKLDETDSTGRTVKTTYLSEANGTVDSDGVNSNMIKAFNQYTGEVDYKEVQIKCKVSDDAVAKTILTNIAEITKYKASNRTSETVDRDSSTDNVKLPEDWPSYKNDELTKDYVPGQEDDDDFEKVIVEVFDLSLRKYITAVNSESLSEEEDRSPNITLDGLNDGSSTTALYEHTKDPKEVIVGDYVTYTIAIYNEGTVDGYATSIEDDIPDGLEFVTDSAINEKYGWVMLDENKAVTDDVTKAKYVTTNYLSKDNGEDNLIKAYDGETLDTKYVQVEFKVVLEETSEEIVENKAQITDDSDEHGRPVKDRDSVPNEWNEHEDDQDIERIKILYFDLSLRKWVTQAIVTVNGETTVTETGHQAKDDPEEVVKVDLKKSKINEVVVKFKYSIRITNEGKIAGYATEIKDHIPDGLTFNVADNPNWVEIEDGIITTNALANTLLQPGESAEVEVILTWVNSETNMGVKVNVAEISKDYNDYGAPDIDSTPDNYVEGEDDIDDAPVMLTVKTGAQTIAELSIALAILVLIALGVKLNKRRAEKNRITDDKFLE